MRRLRCSEPRDGLIELNEPRVYDAYFVTVKALDPELSPGRLQTARCRPVHAICRRLAVSGLADQPVAFSGRIEP